jgi:hypothetical protein
MDAKLAQKSSCGFGIQRRSSVVVRVCRIGPPVRKLELITRAIRNGLQHPANVRDKEKAP